MKRAGVVLVAGLSACGGADADGHLPTAPPARLSMTVPRGVSVVRAAPFDYEALPTLVPVGLGPHLESASWSFEPGASGYRLHMAGRLVADVQVGALHIVREMGESGPNGDAPAAGADALCSRTARPTRARWQGYVAGTRSHEGIVFLCYEGTFDPRSCGAQADRAFRVVARPLLPGPVYGFRVDDRACSPAALNHGERLAIIAPPPLWIGSTAPRADAQEEGSFVRFLLPVVRGSSAAVVMDVRDADLRRFVGAGDEPRIHDDRLVSFSVEVVWPGGDAAPTATGFVSTLEGNPTTTIRPRDDASSSEYSFE